MLPHTATTSVGLAERDWSRPDPALRRDDSGPGFAAAVRLARQVESLEASLRDVERSASAFRPAMFRESYESPADLEGRLAELERRELELDVRERAVELHRMHLQRFKDQLGRGKDSLKRAIAKFHADVTQRCDEVDARSRSLDSTRADLLEARRELTREQIRLKAVARDSNKLRSNDNLPMTALLPA